jgi:hypothetical protein
MAEAALAIVLLFAFSKRKGGSTFGASNFKVWHGYLPSRLILGFAFDLRKVYYSDMKLYRENYVSFPGFVIDVPRGDWDRELR